MAMNGRFSCLLVASLFLPTAPIIAQPDIQDERLQQLLKRFPAADANQDGKLTLEEARAYQRQLKEGEATTGPGASKPTSRAPVADHANVKYGPHERNVFDLWQAKAAAPTPLVVYIHGGGFINGDKSSLPRVALQQALDAGASVMAINYRFRPTAPIQEILRDAARSIQFIRLHAAKYNVDPQRIASFGGSAGAGTSLWLATRDDLADPEAKDPVLRQSSRLSAAAGLSPQATYDLPEWERIVYPFKPEWKRGADELRAFYGFASDAEMETERGRKILADCSMYGHLSKDDPPIWMFASMPDGEPKDRGHLLHHPKHLRVFKARADEVGAPVEVHFARGDRGETQLEAVEFLLKHLQLKPAAE
jgi:acetyl esterase